MNRIASLLAAGVLVTGLAAPAASAAPATAAVDPNAAVPPAGSQAHGWTAAFRRSGPVDKLVLVNPAGTVRTLGAVTDDAAIVDVSPDARHVLTARMIDRGPGDHRQVVTVWDTASRTSTTLTVLADGFGELSVGFDGFLVRHPVSGVVQLRGWDGRVQRTYPKVAGAWGGPVVLPSGRHFLESVGTGVAVRDLVTGKVTNRVAPPAGMDSCLPQGGWDTESASMTCSRGGHVGDRAYRVGLSPAVKTVPVAPLGWDHAWPTTPRLLTGVAYFEPATWVPGTSPRYVGEDGDVVTGAVDGRAYLLAGDAEVGGRGLDVVDLASGSRHRLAPGVFTDAQTVDQVG